VKNKAKLKNKKRKEISFKMKSNGGHVMVWGCMTFGEVGILVSFHGITNVDMLHSSSSDSQLKLAFQQDNDYIISAVCCRPLHNRWISTKWRMVALAWTMGVRDTNISKKFDVKRALSGA
jgi:hypothetical protein